MMRIWSLPALLMMGIALGPHGLKILTPSVVLLLDPIVAMALAMIGVFVGLNVRSAPSPRRRVHRHRRARRRGHHLFARRLAHRDVPHHARGGRHRDRRRVCRLAAGRADRLRARAAGVCDGSLLLLVGGAAAYASLSALFAGLLAGIVWNAARRSRQSAHRADISTTSSIRSSSVCCSWPAHPSTFRRTLAVLVLVVLVAASAARQRPPAVDRFAAIAGAARGHCRWRSICSGERCGDSGWRPSCSSSRRCWSIRQLGPVRNRTIARGTALALGFTLIVALVAGEFLRRFRLPRLTGYLLFGLLVGPYLGNVITEGMARQLQLVTGIATTLIAFIAGLTLNIERLERRVAGAGLHDRRHARRSRCRGWPRWRGSSWPWLPIAPRRHRHGEARDDRAARRHRRELFADDERGGDRRDRLARQAQRFRAGDGRARRPRRAGAVFAASCSSRAPTFGDSAPDDVNMLVRLAWEIGGAVAFGSLVGALFALYLRYVGREVTLALLGRDAAVEPGRHEPARRAAAGGDGRGHRHRERGRRAGRRAEGRHPDRARCRSSSSSSSRSGTSLRLDTLAAAGVAALGSRRWRASG